MALACEADAAIMRAMKTIASFRLATTFGLTALLCACGGGSDSNGNNPDGAPGGGDGSTPAADADNSNLTWTPLITGDWTLAAGGENTGDNYAITLDRDIYIGGIRPIEPAGTHHTVLDSGNAGIIYASGVGTNELIFPPGVGLKLTAGSTLNLQLHTFNPSGSSISGTSGVEIVEVAEADVVNVADIFLPGPLGFSVTAMQETTYDSSCVIQEPQTIFALFPHMHQLGTHFKTTVVKSGVEQVIHNKPYDFDTQSFTNFDEISLSPGDSINTECTWVNTTSSNISWGESSEAEMCFSILYRYPALGTGVDFCTDDLPF